MPKYNKDQTNLLESYVLRCEALQYMCYQAKNHYSRWGKIISTPAVFSTGILTLLNGIYEPDQMKVANILILGTNTFLMSFSFNI